jgi:hypothetical protein
MIVRVLVGLRFHTRPRRLDSPDERGDRNRCRGVDTHHRADADGTIVFRKQLLRQFGQRVRCMLPSRDGAFGKPSCRYRGRAASPSTSTSVSLI